MGKHNLVNTSDLVINLDAQSTESESELECTLLQRLDFEHCDNEDAITVEEPQSDNDNDS